MPLQLLPERPQLQAVQLRTDTHPQPAAPGWDIMFPTKSQEGGSSEGCCLRLPSPEGASFAQRGRATPHLGVHLFTELPLDLVPALLLPRHPAQRLLDHLIQPLHACVKLGATRFAGQGGFVCFLAAGKGRRAVRKGWRDDGQGQLVAGGQGEVAVWPHSPHHPRGVGHTS